MSEISFEEKLVQCMQNSMLNYVKNENYLKMDYNNRIALPKEFIEQAWKSIDWAVVMDDVRSEMQKRICNSIIGSMETEIKTDIKNLLSVAGVREKLRIEIYPKLMQVLDNK